MALVGVGGWVYAAISAPRSAFGESDFDQWEAFGPVQAAVDGDGRGVRLSSSAANDSDAGFRHAGVEMCEARISGTMRASSYVEGEPGGFALGIGGAPRYGDGQRRAQYSAGVRADFAESAYGVPLFEDPIPDVASAVFDAEWHDIVLQVSPGQQTFSVDGREVFTHQLGKESCGNLIVTVWSGSVELLDFQVAPLPGASGGSDGSGSDRDGPKSLVGIWSSSDGTADKRLADNGLCEGFYYSNGRQLDIGGPMTCQLSDQPDSAGRYTLIVSQSPNRSSYLVEFNGNNTVSVYSKSGDLLYTLTRS
ncbi:hypothetical protein [Mycobacterium sp. SMC-4]|uniref:hypothetical protein n=1 Tax=Mycobacterium sp. SMC-4 TaxID=2857059 RepID=UPI0021B363ED|nr:hypothetical protein [Mycobacterium sp. SMC-4]UXA19088.1 hypothetical protein KXD98_05395 [Mycobacterium sp. SMC-4]